MNTYPIINKCQKGGARVGIYSMRNVSSMVARCSTYEFENLICELDTADIISPQRQPQTCGFYDKNIRRIKRKIFNSSSGKEYQDVTTPQHYELFIASCLFISDLYGLACLKDWRTNATVKVCSIVELWEHNLEGNEALLEILSEFDHIILNTYNSVEPLSKVLGKPVHYHPPCVDAVKFCPHPNPAKRSIDVYSMGRRFESVHQALLDWSAKEGAFYLFDTFQNMNVQDFAQHRQLMANIIKRSRFFLVSEAKSNDQAKSRQASEVGLRYAEGAAGGAVLIGTAPGNDMFKKHFFWPDAVISLPDGIEDIGAFMRNIMDATERIDRASQNNVKSCLEHFDWSRLWGMLMDLAGLKPLGGFARRLQRIAALSDLLEKKGAPH